MFQDEIISRKKEFAQLLEEHHEIVKEIEKTEDEEDDINDKPEWQYKQTSFKLPFIYVKWRGVCGRRETIILGIVYLVMKNKLYFNTHQVRPYETYFVYS